MNLEKNFEAFKNLKKPKAIIFDWDNTLANTWPLIHQSIDKTMIKMGQEPWGLQKVKDNVHKSMRESFPEIFGDKWEEAGDFYKNSYRSLHLKIELLDGSLDLINKIAEKNILQFVVSNKIGATLRKEAKAINVDEKFFSLIGASDANNDKPSKAPVELALMGSDIEIGKDEIWFIGDTITDVACALNCGVTPIIYGCDNEVSKTITKDILSGEDNGSKAVAVYFNHFDLIKLLDSF